MLSATNPLDLETLDGDNGFRVELSTFREVLYPIDSAGDINGDGFDDLIVGGPDATPSVIFGRAEFDAQFDIDELDGTNGFRILGTPSFTAVNVSGAGDVNGDGFDDLIVTASIAISKRSALGSPGVHRVGCIWTRGCI